jgi:PAS domain S-box-containing protein
MEPLNSPLEIDSESLIHLTIELSQQTLKQIAAMPSGADTETLQLDRLIQLDCRSQHHGDRPANQAPGEICSDLERHLPRRHVAKIGENDFVDPDYRVIKLLGSGGTAVVYQAHQRAVGREVALKFLRDDLTDPQRSRRRFLDEAQVIGSLDHPNVISIHEVGLDQGNEVFYAMKRVDGTTWNHRLDKQSINQNIEILLDVADAIRYAHSRGIIHRDIKPENVMLGQFGEVLLADWGLAIRMDELNVYDETNDSIGGTPAYMAPELALGLWSRISPRTDIYLLGGLLYRIVTGLTPHRGDNLIECVRSAADNLIQPTRVQSELVDIARRAMNTQPEDRFDTVDQFVAAIRSQQNHAQSIQLTRRAEKRLEEIRNGASTEAFSYIENLLSDAIDLWPENDRAVEVRVKAKIRHAELLVEEDDFESALSIYDSIGMSDSSLAQDARRRHNEEQKKIRRVSRYSTLFVNSPDPGLLVKMPEGTIIEANRAFGEMFGYSQEEVLNRKIPDLRFWVNPSQRIEMVSLIRKNRFIDEFETQLYRRDGEILDVSIAGRMVDVEGQSMMISTIRDLSRRKAAERELEESRSRLRDLQRLARLATWSYNVVDDSISWSEELFRMTGLDPSQGTPTRQKFYELVHPDDRERLRSVVSDAVTQGHGYEISIRQLNAFGNYQTVLIRGEPIRSESGKIVEVYGVSMPQQ